MPVSVHLGSDKLLAVRRRNTQLAALSPRQLAPFSLEATAVLVVQVCNDPLVLHCSMIQSSDVWSIIDFSLSFAPVTLLKTCVVSDLAKQPMGGGGLQIGRFIWLKRSSTISKTLASIHANFEATLRSDLQRRYSAVGTGFVVESTPLEIFHTHFAVRFAAFRELAQEGGVLLCSHNFPLQD